MKELEILKLYGGRKDVYALQCMTRTKHGEKWGYNPVYELLTDDVLTKHLNGEITVGSYIVFDGIKANVCVIDIDTFNLDIAEQIMDITMQLGVPQEAILTTFSGSKGYHVTIFSETALSAQLRALGKKIVTAFMETCPHAVKIDVFPAQDSVLGNNKELGNLVKLPFGIHREVNKRCIAIHELPESIVPIKHIDTLVPSAELNTDDKKEDTLPRYHQLSDCFLKLERQGLPAVGTRHNATLLLRNAYKTMGLNDEVANQRLIAWVRRLNPGTYEHTLEEALTNVDTINTKLSNMAEPYKIRCDDPRFAPVLKPYCTGGNCTLRSGQKAERTTDTRTEVKQQDNQKKTSEPSDSKRSAAAITQLDDNSKIIFTPGIFALENVQKPQPFWENIIDKGDVGHVFGEKGVGKTTLVINMIEAAIRGDDEFLGLKLTPPIDFKLLFVEQDMGAEKFKAYVDRLNATSFTSNRIYPYIRDGYNKPINLMSKEDVKTIIEQIKCLGINMAVFDSLTSLTEGYEIVKPAVTTEVMSNLKSIVTVCGGPVITIHHMNRSGQLKGSNELETQADFCVRLDAFGQDGKVMYLSVDKTRSGERTGFYIACKDDGRTLKRTKTPDLTEEDKALIVELYKQGVWLTDIAEETKCSVRTVSRVVQDAGLSRYKTNHT